MGNMIGGNITKSGNDCSGGACVSLTIPGDASVVSVGISGDFVATLVAEISNDGGYFWDVAPETLNQPGISQISVAAITNIRIRCSVYESGNIGVVLNTSSAGSGSGGTGGSTLNFADAEIPGGNLPGTNFSLAHAPSPAGSLQLFWNGILLKPDTDYTLAGSTITTIQSIQSGDSFLCWYRY